MQHINYYQLFLIELSKKDEDVTKHAHNKIITNIIILVGEFDFNHLYGLIMDEVSTYTKSTIREKIEWSSKILQQKLINEEVLCERDTYQDYTDDTPVDINGADVLESLLYHCLVLKSSFWNTHELACLMFFEENY